VINTFTEAVQTVDIEKAVGKPHTLWVEFAKFYESHDQVAEVCVDSYHEQRGQMEMTFPCGMRLRGSDPIEFFMSELALWKEKGNFQLLIHVLMSYLELVCLGQWRGVSSLFL